MIRELFQIGPVSISPFGVMMVVAFLGAWALLRWALRALEVGDEEDASSLLLTAGIAGILGAKLYYAALYADWRLLFDRSGLVWYGALLLGAPAVAWTISRRRLPFWPTIDAGATATALGYALGRVGCFLVGDDYGYPTDLPWGVRFPYGLPAPTTAGFLRKEYGAAIPDSVRANELVAVHPTQLYEALAGLAICVLGVILIKRRIVPGRTGLAVIGLLALERFGVEFLRAKDDRLLGSFTVAQAISAGVALLVLWLWLGRRAGSAAPPAAS